jgi:thymidylate synthase (FAD)
MIKVKLLEYTPEPERVVAMAARLCYSATGAEELSERLSEEQVQKMVKKMVALGHASTIEHVSFTFGIEGVSRVLTHQLVRHRIASYDQQSQRYVAAHGFQYITPPTIEANPAAKERFDKLLSEIRSAYDELVEMGIPKEDAR